MTNGQKVGLGSLVAVLILAAILMVTSIGQVDAGEACLVKRAGDVKATHTAGWHLRAPLVDRYACYTTVSQVYEVVNEGADSKADYKDVLVDGVTVDGQPMKVTYTVRYKLSPDTLEFVHENVGRDMDKVTERVVKFHSRTIVRQVLNTHTAEELYLGGLDAVSNEIGVLLHPLFADSGVTLEYFELKRPSFSDEYTDAIERKQLEVERAEAEKNKLVTEQQKSEVSREQAQRDADVKAINAEGDARVIELQGEALRNNPEVLELRRIEALENADYMIVPDSSMPIVQVPTPEPTPEKDGD